MFGIVVIRNMYFGDNAVVEQNKRGHKRDEQTFLFMVGWGRNRRGVVRNIANSSFDDCARGAISHSLLPYSAP